MSVYIVVEYIYDCCEMKDNKFVSENIKECYRWFDNNGKVDHQIVLDTDEPVSDDHYRIEEWNVRLEERLKWKI